MGITGLIPFLEKSSSKVHLRDLRGSTVAVDTYCWLHKGVFCCAEKLVRGEETDLYIQYCLKYVQMLLSYDIKPILVFDGRHLPAKELTERRRRESRKESKKRAAELLRLGRVDEARSQMRRCVDVTHEMALRLIRECRLRNVDCIVAPYEADAQMAWLNKADLAQYIITEDSDLTLFGARKVIFKLDLTGAGLLVEADKLYLSMGCHQDKYNFDKFRRMCILSGCDYLDSLPGIGLAKACKFILKTEEDDMRRALPKIPQYLNMKNLEVNEEYIEGFLKAEATFKHMFIYNPVKRRMERLNDFNECPKEESLCCNAGTPLDDAEQALHLALGNLNPFTLKQLDHWHPDKPNSGFSNVPQGKHTKRCHHPSIWGVKATQTQEADKAATTKKAGCALYFKKVDFISKTLDDDIRENLQEERDKPEEAELYLMYKRESLGGSGSTPPTKRQRCDSGDNQDKHNLTPPASPMASRARHNPFAKVLSSTEKAGGEPANKPPPVCENASLLRVLSPKKCREDTKRQLTRVNSLKRSIFETSDAVEVKSRFFAANVKQAALKRNITAPDLSERIRKIESASRQKASILEGLYDEPPESPKTCQLEEENKVKTEGIEAYCDNSNDSLGTISKQSDSLPSSQNEPEEEVKSVVKAEPKLEDETITLSDEDDNKTSSSSRLGIKTEPVKELKPPILNRRVGLSKPKANRATKKPTIDTNQTRLSMFGFQKRPALQ